MNREKAHYGRWSNTMEPMFAFAANREVYVSYAVKTAQARALNDQVKAHIARGGAYQVLPSAGPLQVSA